MLPFGQKVSVLEQHIGVRGGDGNVRLDVRALAPIYTGFTTPRALRSQGRIDGDERSLAALGAIFAGPLPWMQDEF